MLNPKSVSLNPNHNHRVEGYSGKVTGAAVWISANHRMDPVSEGLTVRKTGSCPSGQCHSDMGIPAIWASPFPKPLVIWASPVTLTLTQIAKVTWEGDAHITRVLGINGDSHITVTTVVRACKSKQLTRKKGEHRGNYFPRFPLMGPVSRKAR